MAKPKWIVTYKNGGFVVELDGVPIPCATAVEISPISVDGDRIPKLTIQVVALDLTVINATANPEDESIH